jgi:nitrogen fixation protein FixH
MKGLIVLVVIIGLAAVAGSIVVGMRSFDGTVTDNPYEKGLLWDQTREQMQHGLQVELNSRVFSTGDNDVVVKVHGTGGYLIDAGDMILLRSRPASAGFDQQFPARQEEKGIYRATLSFPLRGDWDLKISMLSSERELLVIKRIIAEKEGKEYE